MSYKNYTIEDFFHDPNFREWVLNPDPEVNYFWEKWLLSHPSKRKDVQIARKMVKTFHIADVEWPKNRKDNLWEKITESTSAISKKENTESKSSTKVISIAQSQSGKKQNDNQFRLFWSKVAVIALIISAGIYFWPALDKEADQEVINKPAYVEKYNPNGQKSKIFLPDGSIVYLNSNSKITYPEKFTGSQRQVKLSGEAFFEVERDTIRPFSVKAKGTLTTALGTSFNVKAYDGNEKVKVALVTGKVTVKMSDCEHKEEVILEPGQITTIDRKSLNLSANYFNYLETIAWKEGILFFNDMPLNKAFRVLEQWYGVSFEYNYSPDTRILVTGTFDNEYLSNVLISLSYTVSFDYSINGNEVKVQFN